MTKANDKKLNRHYDNKPFIPATTFEELEGLDTFERMVYLTIKGFKDGCYLGIRGYGKRAGCCKDTAEKALLGLLEKQRITSLGQKSTRGGKTTIYKVSTTPTLKDNKTEVSVGHTDTYTPEVSATQTRSVLNVGQRYKEDIYKIHKTWNFLENVTHHKKLTPEFEKQISHCLKTFSLEELEKAMRNYNEVLGDPNSWWSHKYTLGDFCTKGVVKFLDNSPADFVNKPKGASPAGPKFKTEEEEFSDAK